MRFLPRRGNALSRWTSRRRQRSGIPGPSLPTGYQQLESRQLLAFSGVFDAPSDTLYLIQTADESDIWIDNGGSGSAFRVDEGGGAVEFSPAQNLVVRLLDSVHEVTLDLDQPIAGDLRVVGLNAGLWLTGDSNTVLGHAALFGRNNDQVFHVSENALLTVGGDLIVGGGNGFDAIDLNSRGMVIGGSLRFDRINEMIVTGEVRVQGNFAAEYYDEAEEVTIDNNGLLQVEGNFTFNFYGNENRMQNDVVKLDGGAQIGGRTWIALGGGSGIGPQEVSLQDSSFGGAITIRGSSDAEVIVLDTLAAPAFINVIGGAGADVVTVGGAAPELLRVDLGGGTGDVAFEGVPGFDVSLLNWAGVHRFHSGMTGELRIVQVAPLTELTVHSHAADGSIGLSVDNGAAQSTLFPATGLRVQMLGNSATPLSLDFDRALPGNLYVWLGDGDRTLEFVGAANGVGGSMRIDGGIGDQIVRSADGVPLSTGLDLFVELRTGTDTIQLDGISTTVGRRMTLHNPNLVVNRSQLDVGDDFTIWMQGSMGSNVFQNHADFHVGRDLVYGGWRGRDVIGLHGTERIDRYLRVAMADEFEVTNGMMVAGIVDFSGGGFGHDAIFRTDAQTVVGTGISVWLGEPANRNEVVFRGQVNGGHLIFHGSSGIDEVVIELAAPLAETWIATADGPDSVTLGAGTLLDRLIIDFGAGDDTFIDELLPPYGFPVELRNLP